MFGIAVHFLTGRYAATQYNDRQAPEWPPHPARLFSALVDAWAAGGQDGVETQALGWLEGLEPPSIVASGASERSVSKVYVPVNDPILLGSHNDQAKLHEEWAQLEEGSDSKVKARFRKRLRRITAKGSASAKVTGADAKVAEQLFPERRTRQDRTFPVVLPHEPEVTFVWSEDPSPEIRATLDSLAARVARLGHSSSLVSCRLVSEAPDPTWVPGSGGAHVLRVTQSGQLDALTKAYEQHQGVDARIMPARKQPYEQVSSESGAKPGAPRLSGEWLVFERVTGPRWPLARAASVAAALRGAVMRHGFEPLPVVITGHDEQHRPTTEPHAAYLALPYVGHRHATGHLMGVAIVLPPDLCSQDRQAVFAAVGRWSRDGGQRLVLGPAGACTFRHLPLRSSRAALRPGTWCRESREWVTVTPIALDRNPGNLHSRYPAVARRAEENACRTVAHACLHAGLPVPVRVAVSMDPLLAGVPPASEFPSFPSKKGEGRFRRVLVHAAVAFSEPVRGPVILGAGRFVGLGLFRPTSGGAS